MMEAVLGVGIGILYGVGAYLLLRRNLLKMLFGLALLSNGANLLIFTLAGLREGHPPIIGEGATSLAASAADPLPQALILTAIVITFGVQAFTLTLLYRTMTEVGTDDPVDLDSTDELDPPHGEVFT